MTEDCRHETTIAYQPSPGLKALCCLECGLTEISFAGMRIRRYFAAPVVLGAMRKSLDSIERHLK